MLESTTKLKASCMNFECFGVYKSETYRLTPAPPLVSFTEQRFLRDPNLKNWYQESRETGAEKGFWKILDESEAKRTSGKEGIVPHHPVLNPNKTGRMRHKSNAALKHKEVCLNDKLLAGKDLLLGLIETISRFCERTLALTVDTESMFLQVQIPDQVFWCFSCVPEVTNLFNYRKISIMDLELEVFQLVQNMLLSEWEPIMKKSIQQQ